MKEISFTSIHSISKMVMHLNQNTVLEKAQENLNQSHEDVMNMIAGFSDEELFSKNFFDWTGTTTLGSYCVSATSSHYDWATKKLRAHIKKVKT